MKILYGVQGTGNGHITRARHMAKAFALQPQIEVDYIFSGREPEKFFDMDVFPGYQSKRGLTFVTKNGRINHLRTIAKNIPTNLFQDIKNVNIKNYDLLINDFEPLSAWAARRAGVPSLSISHQAAFLHNVPKQSEGMLDKLITKYFAPTQYNLGTHWYHFGHHIIPPFVSEELINKSEQRAIDIKDSNRILVYLPFENLKTIRQQLHILSDRKFICYHPSIQEVQQDANISWQALSTQGFKEDLLNCSGVICNSGFELSTECLSLGLPILVKPLQKQYEQLSNAYTLKSLGLCEVLNTLQADDIAQWLQKKQGVKIQYPTNCDAFIRWILDGNWDKPSNICKTLWQQVVFPNHIKSKLAKFCEL